MAPRLARQRTFAAKRVGEDVLEAPVGRLKLTHGLEEANEPIPQLRIVERLLCDVRQLAETREQGVAELAA